MLYLNSKPVDIKKFPNGESKVTLPDVNLRGNVQLAMRYESDADLFHLYLVKKELDQLSVKEVNLNVSYFPYSRMDRKQGHEVFTLKHVADFINDMNFMDVYIDEPHSDVTPALLDRVISSQMSKTIFDYAFKDFDQDKDVLVFPDAGAQKRYSPQIPAKNVLVGNKHRDWETGNILSFELVGEVPTSGRAIIIDDLSSYGGTFMHTGNKLRQMGFKEVYLVVAHAEKSILEGDLLKDDSPVDKVFTSNSIISNEDLKWKASAYRDKIQIYRYNH